MKRSLTFTLVIGLLFSCGSNDSQEQENAAISDTVKAFDTAIPFAGTWVSEAYFNSINEFKSPRKAQEGSEAIKIPDRTLKQTMLIFNFHEGGPLLTVLKDGDKYQLWEVQDDSLLGKWKDIELISPSKIKIGDKGFVKIGPVLTEAGALILEELLFKGQYTTAEAQPVEFKNDGQLTGLGKYSFYSPGIDYIGPGMQVDQVGLGASENDLDWFGFKFSKGALELYKLNCTAYDDADSTCVEVGFGELVYRLKKKE